MQDIEIILENKPGTLATMGEILGQQKISLEGGGVFQMGNSSIAHFLVHDGFKAKAALEAVNIQVKSVNEVIIQKLRQDVPGQLGSFCRRLAESGVNILVQYSDHANQLVVVVDDQPKAKRVSENWMKEYWNEKQNV